jgi:hypothetical protein
VLTETFQPVNFQKTRDRNFDESMSALIADMKKLTSAVTFPLRDSAFSHPVPISII